MCRRAFLICFLLTATGLSAVAGSARARTWTDVTGQHKREAEFVGITAQGKVKLKTPDGATTCVPLSAFSAADRRYIANRLKGDDAQAPDKAKPAADDFTNSIGMKFKLIPAGEFEMGVPREEKGFNSWEQQHRVRITRPFYLGMYEVTQAQYAKVMGDNPVKHSSSYIGPTNPVINVTWPDAVEFCKKLSAKEGRTYRLPTEAEWEYACRAGTTTPFSCGATLSSKTDANFDGTITYNGSKKGPDLRKPAPVGSYRPNPWGLYDMHGNVKEWCSDWFRGSYYNESPVDDPRGPKIGVYRIARGGDWTSNPQYCRSGYRSSHPTARKMSTLGFRVVAVSAK